MVTSVFLKCWCTSLHTLPASKAIGNVQGGGTHSHWCFFTLDPLLEHIESLLLPLAFAGTMVTCVPTVVTAILDPANEWQPSRIQVALWSLESSVHQSQCGACLLLYTVSTGYQKPHCFGSHVSQIWVKTIHFHVATYRACTYPIIPHSAWGLWGWVKGWRAMKHLAASGSNPRPTSYPAGISLLQWMKQRYGTSLWTLFSTPLGWVFPKETPWFLMQIFPPAFPRRTRTCLITERTVALAQAKRPMTHGSYVADPQR